jgi:predicted phage terminase large subunit-like protein
MTVDRERIWSLSLDELGVFYGEVIKANDQSMIRALILADRFFLLTMVLDVKVAWHPWILARCREVERDPDEHLDLWSRGHFKSTIITYAGTVQYVLGHPEDAVCIMSYKSGAAETFAAQIKQAFETNDILLKCFPDVLWSERNTHQGDVWSVSGFTVKRKTGRKEPTIATSGLVSGMLTGGHFNLLIYDDTVTPESVTTPDQIQKTTNAWSMSLNLGTLDGTKHWYIGTRYAMFDTYYEMLKLGTIKERRHICIDSAGKPVLLPQAEFDKKKAEMTTRDWNSQMLQTPIGEGELLMREEWFHTYHRTPDIPMNIYVFVDTAQKQSKSSDYTVMWVVGFGSDHRYYVLDIVRDKLPQSKRCDKLFDVVEKWMPTTVFYEENAAPDDCEFITEKMETRGRFDLRMFRQKANDGSKQSRIETLEPLFREGLIWFPQVLKYRQYDGSWRDLVQDFQRDEFLTYPQVTHDDMLDSLAAISAGNAGVKPYLTFPTLKKRPEMGELEHQRLVGTKGSGRGGSLFAR